MANPITSFVNYLRSAKAELEKVTWPTRQEVLRYSLLVIAVSVVMAGFFAALDYGLGKAVDLALKGRQPAVSTSTQPVIPDLVPVEATDAEGNPVDVTITPIPLNNNGNTGAPIQITN